MKTEQAIAMALRLMKKHNLSHWTLVLDNSKNNSGYVIHKSKHLGLSQFFLSRDSTHAVRDTILHEIAHALLPRNVMHGAKWKALAKKLGAVPTCAGRQSYKNKTFKHEKDTRGKSQRNPARKR